MADKKKKSLIPIIIVGIIIMIALGGSVFMGLAGAETVGKTESQVSADELDAAMANKAEDDSVGEGVDVMPLERELVIISSYVKEASDTGEALDTEEDSDIYDEEIEE